MVLILIKNLLWSNRYELILLVNPSTLYLKLLFGGYTEFILWNVECVRVSSYLEKETMREFKGQV